MFSGIIEEVGLVRNLEDSVLTVQCEMVLEDLSLGFVVLHLNFLSTPPFS